MLNQPNFLYEEVIVHYDYLSLVPPPTNFYYAFFSNMKVDGILF